MMIHIRNPQRVYQFIKIEVMDAKIGESLGKSLASRFDKTQIPSIYLESLGPGSRWYLFIGLEFGEDGGSGPMMPIVKKVLGCFEWAK